MNTCSMSTVTTQRRLFASKGPTPFSTADEKEHRIQRRLILISIKAGFEKYNTNYAHKYISKWNVERQPSVWAGKLQSLEGRTQLYRDFYFNYSAGHRMLENSIDMFSHIYFTTIYLFQLLFWMSGSSGKVLWMLCELNIWPNSFCASFDFFSFFT